MIKHIWKKEYIGHNTYGSVCTTCNAEYFTGMSDLGCPKSIWNEYQLECTETEAKYVLFNEPTEIEIIWVDDFKPEQESYKEANIRAHSFSGGFTVISKFIRNGELLKEHIKVIPRKPIPLSTFTYVRVQPKISFGRYKGTPFLDLLESSSKTIRSSDYQYRFSKPLTKIIVETI